MSGQVKATLRVALTCPDRRTFSGIQRHQCVSIGQELMSITHAVQRTAEHNMANSTNEMGILTASPVIAVVDGAPEFLGLMHEVLTLQGYHAILGNAEQGAFALIRRERPDLVILDQWLEHPSAGEVLLRRMARHPGTQHIPVIVTTTDPQYAMETALRDTCYAVLLKPFHLPALLATIEEILHTARTGMC